MPCLFRVLTGPYRGKVFPVEATRPLLIGRALEADFTIPDGLIEAFHCRVEFERGETGRMAKVIALDPAPEKQLVVDGVPFDEALLKSGDRVRLGETTLEFKEGGATTEPLGGTAVEPDAVCVSCRRKVPLYGGGRVLLGDPYCIHCVDLRLTVKRELGRYRVSRKIARDIAEIVYLAEDLRSEPIEKVALHVLRSERQHDKRVLRRFITKAAFGNGLDHPLFPLTRDLRMKAEVCSYVEDHIDWPTLAERLEANKLPRPFQAAKVAHQVAEGLRYARRRGMIVGKIRANRLFVSSSGAARIREYWLAPETEERIAAATGAPTAEAISESESEEDLTLAQAGTGGDESISADMRRYLAPDPRDLAYVKDEWMDARQTGALLLQLLIGSYSPDATIADVGEKAMAAAASGRRPTAPSDPPTLLLRILARAFDKAPGTRYGSLAEIARDLKTLVGAL